MKILFLVSGLLLIYGNFCFSEVYEEPSEWEEIRARINPVVPSYPPLPPDIYYDKVYGAWLGKCIGGALGMPVEGWDSSAIRERYGEIGYHNYLSYFRRYQLVGWSGEVSSIEVEKDGDWHLREISGEVPDLPSGAFANPIIGLSFEFARERSILEIRNVKIKGKEDWRDDVWVADEGGCREIGEIYRLEFSPNGRAWLRLDQRKGRLLNMKQGQRISIVLEIRWIEGANKVGLAFDFLKRRLQGGFGPDDDTAYQIVDLHTLETHGLDITSSQLGREWVEHLPVACTAEAVALENLKKGIQPPLSARTNNPMSEWIGAQIRGEIWGLIAPGLPQVAVEYAYKDAVISHTGNGIYGELFVSALISYAFYEKDVEKLITLALSWIPPRSRFREVVEDVMRWHKEYADWRDAFERLKAKWGGYGWVHTLPNIGVVILALLYGEDKLDALVMRPSCPPSEDDFGRSLCIACMCGWDTDCNCATVGAILGCIKGAKGIENKWKAPIRDLFRSYVRGFEEWNILELCERIKRIGEKVLARQVKK